MNRKYLCYYDWIDKPFFFTWMQSEKFFSLKETIAYIKKD